MLKFSIIFLISGSQKQLWLTD